MAINLTTLRTDCDAVSDLIEAEADTDAHYVDMADDVKASDTTLNELFRLQENVQTLLNACGFAPPYQKTAKAIQVA